MRQTIRVGINRTIPTPCARYRPHHSYKCIHRLLRLLFMETVLPRDDFHGHPRFCFVSNYAFVILEVCHYEKGIIAKQFLTRREQEAIAQDTHFTLFPASFFRGYQRYPKLRFSTGVNVKCMIVLPLFLLTRKSCLIVQPHAQLVTCVQFDKVTRGRQVEESPGCPVFQISYFSVLVLRIHERTVSWCKEPARGTASKR